MGVVHLQVSPYHRDGTAAETTNESRRPLTAESCLCVEHVSSEFIKYMVSFLPFIPGVRGPIIRSHSGQRNFTEKTKTKRKAKSLGNPGLLNAMFGSMERVGKRQGCWRPSQFPKRNSTLLMDR